MDPDPDVDRLDRALGGSAGRLGGSLGRSAGAPPAVSAAAAMIARPQRTAALAESKTT